MSLYPNPPYLPIEIVRGDNVFLYDTKNNKYLNFAESINIMGHGHKMLQNIICEQTRKLIHFTNMIAENKYCKKLAIKLAGKTGFQKPKIVYTATGTEANEAAILYSRKKKPLIIAFKHSYHGLLFFTGKITKGENDPRNNLMIIDDNDPHSLDVLEKTLYFNNATIIVEALRVHGGIKPISKEAVRIINNALEEGSTVIADEVYTGLGKTGYFFAHQRIGVKTNIITMGKTIGGGLPLGAILFEEKLLETPDTGGALTSQGGNILACRVGSSLVDIIEERKLIEKTRLMEEQIKKTLEKLLKYDFVSDIRGYGFIWGIQLEQEKAKKLMQQIIMKALEKGLMLTPMGPKEEVIRLAPPLTANIEHWEKASDILDEVFHELTNSP